MQSDPFGNLQDWGSALALLHELAQVEKLDEYQPGLARILAYKYNWRLREEVLKQIGAINNPNEVLIGQVLGIIDNENLYYEVRIMACGAMNEFLHNPDNRFSDVIKAELAEIIENQVATPQPPIFADAIKKLKATVHERFGNS